MKDFRDLKVGLAAHQLALVVYKATSTFPREETYGLVSQLRRAATSLPANIAEGCGRGSNPDFRRCLQVAMGSASEVEYFLLLARDLSLLEQDSYAQLSSQIVEIKKMLSALINRVAGR